MESLTLLGVAASQREARGVAGRPGDPRELDLDDIVLTVEQDPGLEPDLQPGTRRHREGDLDLRKFVDPDLDPLRDLGLLRLLGAPDDPAEEPDGAVRRPI